MKIVADDQIPLVDELFSQHTVLKKPGERICREDVVDADMLLVRTVTQVDAALLQHTAVRFVGTATAGYDHCDIDWLNQQGIAWAYAPGANAQAVAEYVLCVAAALGINPRVRGRAPRAGVIGVGRVGRAVAEHLRQIGFQVILNDPPRALSDPEFHSTPLSEFTDLDLISIHAALTREGPYPSYHLLTDEFLQRQNPGTVLLNAARGAIIDTAILLRQPHLSLCLDVWENEPAINLALLQQTRIATPHIAGYSVAAKRRASILLYQQAQSWLGLQDNPLLKAELATTQHIGKGWEKSALAVFDPLDYTQTMKGYLLATPQATAERFSQLRKNYPWRNSLSL